MNKININTGLTTEEVNQRILEKKVNYDELPKTKTIKQIIKDNFINYFNFINLVLGIMAFIAGWLKGDLLYGLKNALFMNVIFLNSIISIIEEIISKKITDSLSIMQESKVIVIRDSKEESIPLNEIVLDDIIKLVPGNQIPADAIVVDGSLEVNEALITGESNPIEKKKNDELLSGSFVISGNAYVQVIHVAKDNYVSKISSEAKYLKKVNSVIMTSFEKLLKILSLALIPSGIILFISQYTITGNIVDSIFATVAALIGMIPEGIVLLTSSVMAVGVIKLFRVKVLVQELNAIESLARVDVICLDKTGTLTEGNMEVVDYIPVKGVSKDKLKTMLSIYASSSNDDNATMKALKNYFDDTPQEVKNKIDFSSSRKYSAIEFEDYSLYIGAPSVFGTKYKNETNKYLEDYRVLAITKKNGKLKDNVKDTNMLGYVLIQDKIRPSAKDTLTYFRESNVDVKIISGDDPITVTSIAKRVGLENAKGIDVSNMNQEELNSVIDEYNVFGRVKPEQKKWIVMYLKGQGHTVAMTGDGVNDVLALKESDCAISIKDGADAARNVSQLILLNNDFNSLPNVVKEGRQTVNNVERSASLLLVKTIYTILLILFSIISSSKYVFIPIQLTLITFVSIGCPSFFLALEPNNEQIKGDFLLKIFGRSLPAALTVITNIIFVTSFTKLFGISYEIQSTVSVFLTAFAGLLYLYKICTPFNKFRLILFISMCSIFIYCAFFQYSFFNLEVMNPTIALLVSVLLSNTYVMFKIFSKIIYVIFNKLDPSFDVK